jgi:hypothetical protein
MPTPLPWSHSALDSFNTCALQYQEVKVLRNFQDVKDPKTIWGDEFHKAGERFIRNMIDGDMADREKVFMPGDMMKYIPYLMEFVNRPGTTFVERKYGLNIKLQPVDFFAKDIWLRGIIDVLTLEGSVALVDDHKTGLNRKKDMQQLIIFALLTFYHHPQINTCHTSYRWVKLGALDRETFYRHQIPEMWATLLPRLEKYRNAFHVGVFNPNPSGLCVAHCPVTTCEYWGKGRGKRK